jgi:O-antigen/teichoic acid export membrane protein
MTIITAVFNIILNLILILKYSSYSLSLATVITEAFGVIFAIFFFNRWDYKLTLLIRFLPAFLAY